MTDENKNYEAPTIEVIGSVEELTQTATIQKYTTNTPDGYSYGDVTLTS
jgi:hypothetical protein